MNNWRFWTDLVYLGAFTTWELQALDTDTMEKCQLFAFCPHDIQFAISKVDMSLLSPQGFSHMVEDRAENQDIGGCGFRGR